AFCRCFSRLWSASPHNTGRRAPAARLPAERRLGHIHPLPRQAFLLVAVEGFSEADAAEVSDVDGATRLHLIEESARELAAEIATDILIIEDEALIAADLEALVKSLGHKVIGTAHTRSEAVTLAKVKQPGLILADIQLADGTSGLDCANHILATF